MSRHHSAALLAFLIWGFFPIPLKALASYPSGQILLFRVLVSLGLLLVVNLLLRRAAVRGLVAQLRQASRPERRRVLALAVVGGLLLVGNWLLFIYTINQVSVQAGSFAYLICPILTALLGFAVLHEQLHRGQWLAISLSAGSCTLLGMGDFRSLGLSVVVALTYAFYLISQRLLRDYDKLILLMLQLVLAAIILVPLAGLLGASLPQGLHDAYLLRMTVVLSVCFTIIPLFLNLYALSALPSGTVGILMYVNPLVSFVLAFLYFHEAATLTQAVAYTVILASVVLYNLPRR
ncbi:EamA family transporter [Hymenobacter sp. J193]|uniref:EamA family transporter n=1 Tax=Hymenobacter sp. J193 TaxID=2898429 RepID=UPI0021507E7C|nr:EamA family transporter [Hymenobacter sp. J193]MCR5887756.1 EamA family transporter [Hymenobacter sp. J193]